MRKTFISLLLFFIAYQSFGQAPTVEWTRSFRSPVIDDYGFMNKTADGGCIIVSTLNEANYTLCLRKLDARGKLQWQKKYGEARTAFASFVEQTVDGGYFVVGNAEIRDYNILELNGSNISVLKINSQGKVEWEKVLGTNFNDVRGSGKQTKDGGYIVTGTATVPVPGAQTSSGMLQEQILVFKLNSSGSLQWQKEIGGPEQNSAQDIQLTIDGGYIIAGYDKAFRKRIDGRLEDDHYLDFSVIRCDSIGNIIWSRVYGTSVHDLALSIATCKDGGFVVAGNTDVSSFDEKALILKIDSFGNELWRGTFGDKGINILSQIVVDQNDEVIAAGVAAHEGEELAWLFKLDANGALKWNTYYNGPVGKSRFKGLIIAKDGHIVTAGTSDSKEGLEAPYENNQIWILKLR